MNTVMSWLLRMSTSAAVQVCKCVCVCVCVCVFENVWRHSEQKALLSFPYCKCSDKLTFENVYQRRGTSVSKMCVCVCVCMCVCLRMSTSAAVQVCQKYVCVCVCAFARQRGVMSHLSVSHLPLYEWHTWMSHVTHEMSTSAAVQVCQRC